MFKSFKEGLRMGWIKVDLEELIKAYGYHLIYYPNVEANRLAEIYPNVQEAIEKIKSEELYGATIPSIKLVIIIKSLNPTEMVFYLVHEYAHILTEPHELNTPKLGHTTAFFEAEQWICDHLNIPVMEREEDYDENGIPKERKSERNEGT